MDFVLANGCEDTEISFENPVVSGYDNPNAPADERCHVFSVNGGHISFASPPQGALDKAMHDSLSPGADFGQYSFATSCGINLGTGTGAVFTYDATGFPCYYAGAAAYESSSDLFMFAFFLTKEVCLKINELVGINVMSDQGNAVSALGEKFVGTYRFGAGGGDGMVRVESPRGAMQGCVDGSAQDYPGLNYTGGYYYFRLLVAR